MVQIIWFAIQTGRYKKVVKRKKNKKMKILVLPDIHGRKFWKAPCERVENYDKVIFLGDYMDPYGFEGNSVEDAIANFEEIIDFANSHKDKVVLLLGNHDMPYFSETYNKFSWSHCRHSKRFHNDIASLFEENKDMFKIAYTIDDILFTHAGCTSEWLTDTFTKDYPVKGEQTLDDLVFSLNNLLNTKHGLKFLYHVGRERGGWNKSGSCIWADVYEIKWDVESVKDEDARVHFIHGVKQVFGHTLQAFEDKEGKLFYGDPIEEDTYKMLDNTHAYELDTKEFKATML